MKNINENERLLFEVLLRIVFMIEFYMKYEHKFGFTGSCGNTLPAECVEKVEVEVHF